MWHEVFVITYPFRNWCPAIQPSTLCRLFRRTYNGQIGHFVVDKMLCTLYYNNWPNIELELCVCMQNSAKRKYIWWKLTFIVLQWLIFKKEERESGIPIPSIFYNRIKRDHSQSFVTSAEQSKCGIKKNKKWLVNGQFDKWYCGELTRARNLNNWKNLNWTKSFPQSLTSLLYLALLFWIEFHNRRCCLPVCDPCIFANVIQCVPFGWR